MAIKENHELEEQLIYLHSLKKEQLGNKKYIDSLYAQEEQRKPDPNQSYYPTHITFSIIQGKMAELASGIQEYDFIPLDSEAEKNVPIVKYVWNYEWLTTNTDANIYKAFQSALKHGDGYIYEGTRRVDREINIPNGIDAEGKTIWIKEVKTEWDGIYQEFIPIDEIYHDGVSIDDANEAIWIKHWDRTAYINSFKNNPNYKAVNESLPFGRHYYVGEQGSISINGSLKDKDIISELRYYNLSKDEYKVLANGIEVHDGHIPYAHKQLPFIQAIDIYLDDRVGNMGEYELLKQDELFKTAIRGLKIDVMKYQFGFTAIDPDANVDTSVIEFGPGKFTEIDPNSLKHFAPSISTNSLNEAEMKADEDIIIKSGHDFRSQLLSPDETAEKTRNKSESTRKRINYTLKQNGLTFFSRLAKLRMANIQEEYKNGPKKISIKGGTIDSKGVFRATKSGYGTFTTKPAYIKGVFNILPITDSILGISTERDKKVALEFIQVVGNMMGEDGKPIISNEKTVAWISRKFGINFEDITSKGESNKTTEQIMRELEAQTKGESVDPTNPASPDFIPPAQRSGANKNVATIGGGLSA